MRHEAIGILLAISCASSCARPYYHRDYVAAGVAGLGDPTLVGRVILVGDAGDALGPSERVRSLVAADVARAPSKTSVVWLGDNVYDRGLPPAEGPCAGPRDGQRALSLEIEASGPSGHVVFVPGNHDWRADDACAPRLHASQAKFIADYSKGAAHLLPEAPCPGPVSIDLGGFLLIAFNSEWLLRESETLAAACAGGSGTYAAVRARFFEDLGQLLDGADPALPVILASHHPLRSHGEHGGKLNGHHLFLDFLWRPLLRQNLAHPAYRRLIVDMERTLRAAAARHPGRVIVYAAGHDHDLQVLKPRSGATLDLVSGSGSRRSPVGEGRDTWFADSANGYMTLERVRVKAPHSGLSSLDSERLFLDVVETGPCGERKSVFRKWLGAL